MHLEAALRGAGVEPLDAALAVARRAAFNLALLGELGRKLPLYSRETIGSALAEVQMELNEAEAERVRQHREAVEEAVAQIRAAGR